MSLPAFTPGPWRCLSVEQGGEPAPYMIIDESGDCVARVPLIQNARLIATAASLHAALSMARQHIDADTFPELARRSSRRAMSQIFMGLLVFGLACAWIGVAMLAAVLIAMIWRRA